MHKNVNMSIYRGRSRKEFSLASSLYDSIRDSDFRGVNVLIGKGADPNIILQGPGISSFHLTIGNDSADFALKTVKLILQHKGNPNIKSDEGLTPLHIAAAWGRIDIVELLLNCGADPEIRDSDCAQPIDYAIEYKHREVVIRLRQALYGTFTIENLQDNENYLLALDKIIVNNGIAEAEYEVETVGEKLSIDKLQQLPQTKPNDYVRNWCCTHSIANNAQNEPEEKKNQENLSESKENSYDSFNFSAEPLSYPQNFAFVNCTRRTPNKNVIENFSLPYESSLKYKSRKTSSEHTKGMDIPVVTSTFCKHLELSRESGIVTLPDTTRDIDLSIAELDLNEVNRIKTAELDLNEQNRVKTSDKLRSPRHLRDASSDYFTCNEISGSTNILEHNIFDLSTLSADINSLNVVTKCSSHGISFGGEITELNGITNVPCNVSGETREGLNDASFFSIAEVYKYIDDQQGVVLYEKRLLVNQKSDRNESTASPVQSQHSQSSKLSSLPASFDYDTDTLRQELTQRGFNPGPITRSTKRVYLRKLHHLKRRSSMPISARKTEVQTAEYSVELEKTLKNPNWVDELSNYKNFEDIIAKEFSNPDPSRKWREGVNKSSFTYLLLDPRITSNLPSRAELLSPTEIWQTFISSIFYVGKGKRSRPYSHLYEAATLWKEQQLDSTNKKLQHILNIWGDNCGVVCLHVFQNVIPVEAYTREAAMINALKISNIKNIKSGDFYGTASTWNTRQQKMLGVLLLYRAMLIFLNEGERQLRPADIN